MAAVRLDVRSPGPLAGGLVQRLMADAIARAGDYWCSRSVTSKVLRSGLAAKPLAMAATPLGNMALTVAPLRPGAIRTGTCSLRQSPFWTPCRAPAGLASRFSSPFGVQDKVSSASRF